MENKEFARNLELRTKKFALEIIRLSASLPKTIESNVLRNQVTRSGTSIGANYREANRSRSKLDFKNKISICESESSETVYWLDLIEEANWISSNQLTAVKLESVELLAIFTSIGSKL